MLSEETELGHLVAKLKDLNLLTSQEARGILAQLFPEWRAPMNLDGGDGES